MDETHGFLTSGYRRHGRRAIGILLKVPLGKSFVVPTLTRMKDACLRLYRYLGLFGLDSRGIRFVPARVTLRLHRDDEGTVSVAHDVHEPNLHCWQCLQ
jgi:hypothetical protein